MDAWLQPLRENRQYFIFDSENEAKAEVAKGFTIFLLIVIDRADYNVISKCPMCWYKKKFL